jgi:hypothetical protein
MLTVATNGERLACGGFSLSEIIHSGSLEFITDCFGSLCLSPKGSESCTMFVGTTHSGSPSLHAMIEDSTNKFHTTSSGVASSSLPISRMHGTRAPPAPITTIPWLEDAPCTQTMTMVPPQTLSPCPDNGFPLEQ